MKGWWRRALDSSHTEPLSQEQFATTVAQQRGPLRPTAPEQLFTPGVMHAAWLAIRRAGGGAGVDGVTLKEFAGALDAELETLRAELAGGRYQPRPIRQIMVPKRKGGLRPLALWALRDRIAQRAVYEIIAPSFEANFLPCSFGFRPGLGTQDAVNAVIAYRDQGLRWIVDADIKHCFDRIDHRLLMRLVCRGVHDRLMRRIIQSWLQARILNSADGVPRYAGASQGSALSPLLANIYLHEFDRVVSGRRRLALVRYADDFVICTQRKGDAEEAEKIATHALRRLRLELNPHKSRIVHLDEGFSWLGHFLIRNECYRL